MRTECLPHCDFGTKNNVNKQKTQMGKNLTYLPILKMKSLNEI